MFSERDIDLMVVNFLIMAVGIIMGAAIAQDSLFHANARWMSVGVLFTIFNLAFAVSDLAYYANFAAGELIGCVLCPWPSAGAGIWVFAAVCLGILLTLDVAPRLNSCLKIYLSYQISRD
jgi:hypothetical protein